MGKIKRLIRIVNSLLFYSWQFKSFGERSVIYKPLKLQNTKYIFIGKIVVISKYTWLSVLKKKYSNPQIIIEDGCRIGHFNHISAINSVVLHKNVLTADKVYISDHYHNYSNPNLPIHQQEILSNGSVEIGENTWIGESVTVVSCKIGRNCVIGANSFVNKDIPNYCVAVGSPAKVIKTYDFKLEKWVEV